MYDSVDSLVRTGSVQKQGMIMDIAEFLTARIARDEERARLADWDDPVRLTAECVAKRRIMALHDHTYGARPWPCATLLALAAVYAWHPDYDPAWQPNTDDGRDLWWTPRITSFTDGIPAYAIPDDDA